MKITAHPTVWLEDDVDTDQIIPARFLKTTERTGLGKHLFADRPDAPRGPILVVGANFGCGSSREHAPWALLDAGVRAIVARSFADIFRANALKNGLVPVALAAEAHARVVEAAASGRAVTVDVDAMMVSWNGGTSVGFSLDAFARRCLLAGVDELGYLLSFEARIAAYEADPSERAPAREGAPLERGAAERPGAPSRREGAKQQ
ncbi:MAG TPA: 3-isopropylmalate dehydratase small subunit [Haliangiales bacterium]|nr:3-isopropylmalate dehydratase small subunit [Haliangiales bacterium]